MAPRAAHRSQPNGSRLMDKEQFYSPSSAYAEAIQRGPDHDAMQLAFVRWRRKQINTGELTHEKEEKSETGVNWIVKCRLINIEIEHPIKGKYGIRAFADVAETWATSRISSTGNELTSTSLRVYELKPKIYSCGAFIRQIIALADAADAT